MNLSISAIKQDNSRSHIGVGSWKGLLAGKEGKIERDDTRSPVTEAEVKVCLTSQAHFTHAIGARMIFLSNLVLVGFESSVK